MPDQVVMESPVNGERTITTKDAFTQVWSKKDPAWKLVTEEQDKLEAALNGEGEFATPGSADTAASGASTEGLSDDDDDDPDLQ